MTHMQNLQTQLINSASLLELTREYEAGIDRPVEIELHKQLKLSLWDTGVLSIEPTQSGRKAMVISSGIHGNETAPIEICDQLVQGIIQQTIKPANRVLFIIGNPVAMNQNKRFDIENMNRLFCGKHQGKHHHEAHRAAKLENYLSRFFNSQPDSERYHYDLHTAIRGSKYRKFAIYPYPDGRAFDKQQLAFFLACQINTILFGHQPAGTFSYFSSHTFAAHAFTVELGQVKPFGQNDMSEFTAVTKNLTALIEGNEIPLKPFHNDDFNLFQVHHELIKHCEKSFRLNIADDVKNFTDFPAGFQLSNDRDGGYITETEGEAIVFPNPNVPVGQRAGLIVKRTQI